MVLVLADLTRQYPRIYGGHNNPQIIKPSKLLYLVQSDLMTVVYYIQRGSSANQYPEQDTLCTIQFISKNNIFRQLAM